MPTFVAAAVQMNAGADLEANLDRARALVRRAADRGAVLVVLPEVFAWRGQHVDEPAATTPIPGRVSEFLCALAAELRIVLVGGSFLEHAPGMEKSYNTSLVVDADGSIRAAYRKIHLFDIDLPGQVSVRESETRAAGSETVTATTPPVRRAIRAP